MNPRELERRLGVVVAELEARVVQLQGETESSEDGEGKESERRRLTRKLNLSDTPSFSRLVAVLAFIRRVLSRVVRPSTLLKAAMQALAVASVKLGEGEVLLSQCLHIVYFFVATMSKSSLVKGADFTAAKIHQLANRKAS